MPLAQLVTELMVQTYLQPKYNYNWWIAFKTNQKKEKAIRDTIVLCQ